MVDHHSSGVGAHLEEEYSSVDLVVSAAYLFDLPFGSHRDSLWVVEIASHNEDTRVAGASAAAGPSSSRY